MLTASLIVSGLALAFVVPTPYPRTAAHTHVRLSAPQMMNDDWSYADDAYLRDAIARASSTRHGKPHTVLQHLKMAYVLIFNPGRHDEGVYTLQGRSHASPYVLCFERDEDAARFSHQLLNEGFDLATPLCWDVDELAHFCTMGQFEVSLVPQGTLLTPPAKNEYDRDAFDAYEKESSKKDPVDPNTYVAERMALERIFMQGEEPMW